MDRGIYFIWALLPFSLFCLVVWSKLRRFFRSYGQEPIGDYFRFMLFALLGYFLAIGCDKLIVDRMRESIDWADDTFDIISWLTYPAVLLLMAQFQAWQDKEKANSKNKATPRKVR